MNPVETERGNSPIVLGFPHTGTYMPDDIFKSLNPLGQTLGDTDWHIHRLYDGVLKDVTIVRATFHRYVIDANRNPDGDSLYPGRNTTGLIPLTNFDGEPIWNTEPGSDEVSDRLERFHLPYHTALAEELDRVRQLNGIAILYDCHSIRSHIPYLFDGTLPDFNIGTNEGQTCSSEIEASVVKVCRSATNHSSVTNGRFKGGWTTRHYGRPDANIHAIQMELAQSTYLKSETAPYEYDEAKARLLRGHLKQILETLALLAPTLEQNNEQ